MALSMLKKKQRTRRGEEHHQRGQQRNKREDEVKSIFTGKHDKTRNKYQQQQLSKRVTSLLPSSSTLMKCVFPCIACCWIGMTTFIIVRPQHQNFDATFLTNHLDTNYYYSQLTASSIATVPAIASGPPDTAVIISSSWIPTHPSTVMLDAVLHSVRSNLIGLNYTTAVTSDNGGNQITATTLTPIFIIVDALPLPSSLEDVTEKEFAKLKRHVNKTDSYIWNLYTKYLRDPQIHIVVNQEHYHVGGSVYRVLQQIKHHYPTVQYLYYVQHDFQFIQRLDHHALLQVLRTNTPKQDDNNKTRDGTPTTPTNTTTTNNNTVNYIRFQYMYLGGATFKCNDIDDKIRLIPSSLSSSSSSTESETETNLVLSDETSHSYLCKSCKYSDNNHLVRFDWYYNYFEKLGTGDSRKRSPEDPMQYLTQQKEKQNSCDELGLYAYHHNYHKSLHPRLVLDHLNGRRTRKQK